MTPTELKKRVRGIVAAVHLHGREPSGRLFSENNIGKAMISPNAAEQAIYQLMLDVVGEPELPAESIVYNIEAARASRIILKKELRKLIKEARDDIK